MTAVFKITLKTRKIRKTVGRRELILLKHFIYLNGIEQICSQQGDYEEANTFLERMEDVRVRLVNGLKHTQGDFELIQERINE